MVGYSGTPLIKKLGIKTDGRTIFINAPKSISFTQTLTGEFDYIHLFSKSESQLKTSFEKAKNFLKRNGAFWVSWPKSGKLGTDLNENTVRDIGIANGLVDIKVVAIDEIWSGLKFVYRLKDR